jgi:mono/diheme cytochrome c family protein
MRKVIATLAGIVAMSALVGAQAAKVEAGKALFTAQKCSTCHKVGDVGGKLASDLSAVGAKLSDGDIRKWLTKTAEMEAKLETKPKAPMSGFMKTHKLSDADVDALAAYLGSLKK